MSRVKGYWLSEHDAVSVEGDHADPLLEEPERFGLTREELLEIYEKHGEEPGKEGFARDEAIRAAAAKGWVRIRIHDVHDTFVMVQGYEPEEKLPLVSSFLCDLLHRDIIAADETVVLSNFSDSSTVTLDWSNGGASSMINDGCTDL